MSDAQHADAAEVLRPMIKSIAGDERPLAGLIARLVER